jgi:hypothetical protein
VPQSYSSLNGFPKLQIDVILNKTIDWEKITNILMLHIKIKFEHVGKFTLKREISNLMEKISCEIGVKMRRVLQVWACPRHGSCFSFFRVLLLLSSHLSSSHSNGLPFCGVLLHWPLWVPAPASSSVGVSSLPAAAVKNMRI